MMRSGESGGSTSGRARRPKGLASAPGGQVAPYSPVVFDVKLIYIPGME